MNLKKLKTLVLDVDGTLVSAKQPVDHEGRKVYKYFHTRDSVCIRKLLEHGYNVLLVTSSSWLGVEMWAKKIGCEYIYTKHKHELGLDWDTVLSVGDDYYLDKQMLDMSAEACIVSDADIRLLKCNDYVILDTKGGDGIMSELIYRFDLL